MFDNLFDQGWGYRVADLDNLVFEGATDGVVKGEALDLFEFVWQ